MRNTALAWISIATLVVGCEPSVGPAPIDAGTSPDAGPMELEPLSTAHCRYAPLPATARAGGAVSAGAIRVGLAELPLDLPIGVALGGNTSRAEVLDAQGVVDGRQVPLSGSFTPSVGYETVPEVKAIAISAGDEVVVILRTDTIFGDDTITHEVTERLGPELAGKVLWASSHTHTAGGQYSADTKYQVGAGRVRGAVRRRLIDRMVAAAELALEARVPARIGIATEEDFDPEDRVSYDRRDENDVLFGGEQRKDRRLAVIRIDAMDGAPMAILPIFGVHSAILDDDVSVFSTDASGAFERLIEEQFDREVMVVHLQGAAGDVLGSSQAHLEFSGDEPRWDFARDEECGRYAMPQILAVWERAGESMASELEMEMVTRSVVMGPDWETFTVRDGALRYAPWDGTRACDREVYASDGAILSPIDEFNAREGAGLCGEADNQPLPVARMPNTQGLVSYNSCVPLGRATQTLGILLDFEFGDVPICSSTRTTVSALRLGDYLFATAPGEPVVQWRDAVVARSPVAPERTFVIGYAQGHNGYLLTPEDWLLGGFEPSINSWGPLEGEYVAERMLEVMELAVTPQREDAAAGGSDRVIAPAFDDLGVPMPDAAPMAGTVPATLPDEVYFRRGRRVTSAEPDATVERVRGLARFAWIGEDPLAGTPRVRLERETIGGAFEPVRRRSGREVSDLDLLVLWTPQPLAYTAGTPRTHYWTVEWQAVSWTGAPGLGELADRPGVPLGRYRFHVSGTGYELDSPAFEVVPASIDVVATRDGAAVVLGARFASSAGWRLMTTDGRADRDVPVTSSPVHVTLEYAGGETEELDAPIADGRARVMPSRAEVVTGVVVRDRFGNRGAAAL